MSEPGDGRRPTEAAHLTLAERWLVTLPVLQSMLGEELEAASLRVAGDDIYLRVEPDVGGIGFVAGLPGESRAEAAARLLDGVADWLPETERYWGRQFLRCPGDLSGQARSSTATQ